MRMMSKLIISRDCCSDSGQGDSCPEKGQSMEPMVMTVEEFRTYIRSLPDNVILRVSVQEDSDESESTEKV